MNEFILVEFDEIREVIIDGNASGYNTGDVIELDAGTHTISMAGPENFFPKKQDVNPTETDPLKPKTLYFVKVL